MYKVSDLISDPMILKDPKSTFKFRYSLKYVIV